MSQQSTFIQLPSAPMQMIYKTIQKVVKSNIPILITGETGVGKEGIARYIHESSPRRDKPFIAINCGRFSAEFLQSDLFGHKAGAFTSTIRQRQGAFEIADGGVLFFDEISDMSMDAQKTLLRVLDTATFIQRGGNKTLTVDVHIIASTNKDIQKIVAEGEFREDLYYRLNGMMLHLLPLRKRTEDIPPLVAAFITEFSTEYGRSISGITSETLALLEQAAWPGNIRQLRNMVQTAIALATTETLELTNFPDIYPEFAQMLVSNWKTLHPEIQHTIMHQLSTLSPEQWRSSQSSYIPRNGGKVELLNIADMNQNQLLRVVAQERMQRYTTLREAAESLGIDTRTLQRYAQWEEDN